MQEQKPRRWDFPSRNQYRQALGKWRRNWMLKSWRLKHLKRGK